MKKPIYFIILQIGGLEAALSSVGAMLLGVIVTALPPIEPVVVASSEFCKVTVNESNVILPMVVYVPLMLVEEIPLNDPEGTPAIVTLWDELCRPWFLALIFIIAGLLPNVVPDPAVAFTSIGFCFNVCVGTSSLTRNTVPVVASVNEEFLEPFFSLS